MKVQSGLRYMLSLILCLSFTVIQNSFTEKCAQEKIALHRGFQYPEYSNTYAAVQLFSIADIGRTTYCVKKPISMVLSRPGDYEPECELNSSPMLKIKASGASIDFNGFEIKKVSKNRQGEFLSYGVGIEVGYSPAELAADPSLEQVQNVVIKNGGLSNFEMGIVVHAGVKNVIIQDFYISRSPLGILFLGQEDNQIASCMLKQVRVTGDFEDDSLILQWAKQKVEQIDLASIDSANGGSSLLQGKPGQPAAGFGYGVDYCFQELHHNPVSNVDDAYSYYGIFIKHGVNIMLNNVMVKCIGYQGDAHEVVAPGQTVGDIFNPATSAVSINGEIIAGQVTSTVARGISIINCSTIFLKSCEAVNCVSALITYGLYCRSTSTISIQNSAFSTNDAHHQTTGIMPAPVIDADVKFDEFIVDPKTGATINSLYSLFCVDIAALPTSVSPAIDVTIEPFRDGILDHKSAIDAGVSLSEMLFHVEQIVAQAQSIITAYKDLVLAGSSITSDDADAHLQAAALLKSGSDLYKHLFKSAYRSGRSCYGLYFDKVVVIELQDIIASYNKAQHYVAGLQADYCDVLSLKSVDCNHNISDDLGDDSLLPVVRPAEGQAYGVHLFHADTLTMHDVRANFNKSFGLSRGIYGYQIDSCKACGISCTNNEAIHPTLTQGFVAGFCFFDGTSCTIGSLNANANHANRRCEGVHAACLVSSEFECCHADDNISDNHEVVGAHFDRCNGLGLSHISTTANCGSLKSFGSLFHYCLGININGAACNDNKVDCLNLFATDCFGMYFSSPEACFLKQVSASGNRGRTLGVGLYADHTRTFHVDHSDFCLNSCKEYVDGEADRCNDAPNASKFFSRDYPSGALGMYFVESCDVSLEHVTACKNFGLRAAGIFCLKSSDFVLCDCITSFQSATGQYFINDPFKLNDLDPLNNILFCNFPIPLTQYSTLFGSPELEDPLNPPDIIPADQINLLEAICCYLRSVALIPGTPDAELAIKNDFICGKTGCLRDCSDPCDPCPGSIYCAQKKFVASWLLIQAAMTKYRLFGSAVGLHIHDCDGFAVKNHFANGNTSLKDNAAGIACTGSNSNHIFDGTRAINNDAWTESELSAVVPGRYYLSAVKPFYDALYQTTTDTLTNDFDIGAGDQLMPRLDRFCRDIINKKVIDYFKISLDCSCPGGSGTPEDFWFTSPVGGIGVGVLLGDCAEHIEVRNIDCANNKGYSGFAFGLLQDVSANNNIDSNRFYQNYANLLGLCFGIADITIQSTSIIMRNFMFCNRIGDYLNFNYLVPYNPGDPFGLSFPIKTAFNGDFAPLINAGGYDNVEVRFIKLAPQNPCVPDYIGSRDPTMPMMPSCWESAGFLDSSGSTITTVYQQCIDDVSAVAPATGGQLQSFVTDIISAVLSSPAGPIAVSAGRDAGVAAGLLEVVAYPAATVADSNRMLSLSSLQELVCQEIFTQLNNDPVLLVVQEALSLLVARKRGHLPGMNHFDARVAAVQAGLKKGLLPIQAEAVATVATAILEHCLHSGGDAAVYAGREMFAMVNALMQTTLNLSSLDIVEAQKLLGSSAIAPVVDTLTQESLQQHVALRLKRGASPSEALATVIDTDRSYEIIVSEFKAAHPDLSHEALSAALAVIASFFDLEYEGSLSGSPLARINEVAVLPAAEAAAACRQQGKTAKEALLVGLFESIVRRGLAIKYPLKTQEQLDNLAGTAVAASQLLMINCLKDLQSNSLLAEDQKEVSAIIAGLVGSSLHLFKGIDQIQSERCSKLAAEEAAQLMAVFMEPCKILAHTISMQINQVSQLAKLAGLGVQTAVKITTQLFDFVRKDFTNIDEAIRACHVVAPLKSVISYNSSLDYPAVAVTPDGLKVAVAGSGNGGSGQAPGVLILSNQGLLVKKIEFEGVDVTTVAAHPTKELLFVGLSSGQVKLVDMTAVDPAQWHVDQTALLPTHNSKIESLAVSEHGLFLASCDGDKMVKVVDISHATPARWFDRCPNNSNFNLSSILFGSSSLAFQDRTKLAVIADQSTSIVILNIDNCSRTMLPISDGYKGCSLSCSADRSRLAVTTDDSGLGSTARIELFDTSATDPADWTALGHLSVAGSMKLHAAAYHQGKDYLIAADGKSLRLFDLSGHLPSSFSELVVPAFTSGLSGDIVAISWSLCGRQLAVTTTDSGVVLFDSSAEDPAVWSVSKSLQHHKGTVNQIACDQLGSRAVSVSDDQSVKIWDIADSCQQLIASIDSSSFPTRAHTAAVSVAQFSVDGNYLFTGSADGLLKVWNVSSVTPVFVDQIALSAPIICADVIAQDDIDYVVLGLDNGQIKMLSFDRSVGSITQLHSIDDISYPAYYHTDTVRSVRLSADGSRLVSASKDGSVKCWDVSMTIAAGLEPVFEGQLNANSFTPGLWHAGAVISVDMSKDGNLIISGGDDGKVILSDVTTLAAPLHRSITSVSIDSIVDVKLHPSLMSVAIGGLDGFLGIYTISSSGLLELQQTVDTAVTTVSSLSWCRGGSDLLYSGNYGFGRLIYLHQVAQLIAKQVALELPDQDRALYKVNQLADIFGISRSDSVDLVQAAIDHLQSFPTDSAGAAARISSDFTAVLAGKDLCRGMIELIKKLDHPIDEAVALARLQGADVQLALSSAEKMYQFLREHPLDVDAALQLCTIYNRFCRSVAYVLHHYGLPQATYLFELAYPAGDFAGLSTAVVAEGLTYLQMHAGDIDGAAQVICDELMMRGYNSSQAFNPVIESHLQDYVGFSQYLLRAIGLQPINLPPAGGSGYYHEVSRLTSLMLDLLRADPTSLTFQAKAEELCLGSSLFDCIDPITSNMLDEKVSAVIGQLDVATTSALSLTKQVARTVQDCQFSDVTMQHSDDEVETAAIAAAVVGRMQARKVANLSLDSLSLADIASMSAGLLHGGLLPAGSLSNLIGKQLQPPAGPGGSWGSSSSVLVGPFTTFSDYLDNLVADLRSPATGLIDQVAEYASLTSDEKDAIARAVVLKTLLTGDEQASRDLVSGVVDSEYPAEIATLIHEIVTTTLVPLTGLSQLTLVARQEIAATMLLFYDEFAPFATSSQLQAIVGGAYASALAAGALGHPSMESFFAVVGGLATAAGFMQDQLLHPSESDQQSVFDFIAIGSEIARGLINGHMAVTAIGATGQDGLSLDLSQPLLASLVAATVLESLSVIKDKAIVSYGQFAVPLAYNQIFGDQLAIAIARIVQDNGNAISLGSRIGQFAGLSSSQATAVATAAVGPVDLQAARQAVAREFELQSGKELTAVDTCKALVSHLVDLIHNPASFSLNVSGLSLFGQLGSGHPIDRAQELLFAAGLPTALAQQQANQLYENIEIVSP